MKRFHSVEVIRALDYVAASTALLSSQIQGGSKFTPEKIEEELTRINDQLKVVKEAASDDAFEQAGG